MRRRFAAPLVSCVGECPLLAGSGPLLDVKRFEIQQDVLKLLMHHGNKSHNGVVVRQFCKYEKCEDGHCIRDLQDIDEHWKRVANLAPLERVNPAVNV
jgi:hypothetical protein